MSLHHSSRVDRPFAYSASSHSPDELCVGSPLSIAIAVTVAVASAMIVAAFKVGFFFEIRPFGTAPDLCMAFVIASGLLFGSRFGGVVGLASGFFVDAMVTGGFSMNVIFFTVCGIVVGFFRIPEPRPIKDLWRFIAVLSAAMGVRQFLLALWVIVSAPSISPLRLLLDIILREIFCTALFSIPIYLLTLSGFAIRRRVKSGKGGRISPSSRIARR